jgi:hypothetical protein
MRFFTRLVNGWRLALDGFRFLKTERKLLVFPLLSGLACAVVILSFVLPLWGSGWLKDNVGQNGQPPSPVLYGLLFAFYILSYFVIIFFNSALIACAIIRFNGGEPTIGDGLGASMSRLPQIFGWALVAGTVGFILKIIENSSERAGEFVAGILGLAWTALTFFVVPVLVVEKAGPIKAFTRSASILKHTWGEAVGARFGIGIVIFLLTLVALVPAFLGFLVGTTATVILGLVVTGFLLILVSLISAAVQAIVVAALYQYAAESRVPAQFEEELLRGAFAAH